MAFLSLRALTFFCLLVLFAACIVDATPAVKRDSRTSAPSGAVVVRGSGTKSGEHSTVQSAVDSLPDDGTERLFLFMRASRTSLSDISIRGRTE